MYYDQINDDQIWKWKVTVTAEMVDAVASTFSDYNPIHMDHDAAVNMGFKTRVFHGVGLVGLISSAIATELPGPGSILLKIDSSFSKPAYLDDELSLELSVIKKNKLNNSLKLTYIISNNESGRLAFGNASVLVPTKIV